MRQPAIDCGLDEIGGEESQRDCHVDLSRAAVLPLCDAVRICCWITDEFTEPTAATGDRFHQSRTCFGTHRARVFRPDPLGQKNFTAPPCRCLLPRDLKSAVWRGKMDDQTVRLDLDARNVSMDETTVINGI